MKLGNIEIKAGANEVIIGAVIALTLLLLFISPPKESNDLFKVGFGALIAWAAIKAGTSKGE
jgi:hypothetical protein